MGTPAKTSKSPSQTGITWVQAVRDIVVTAINRGQLPVLGFVALALLMVYRLPEAAVAELFKDILDSLRNGALTGYGLWVVTIGFWYWHARSMRKAFSD